MNLSYRKGFLSTKKADYASHNTSFKIKTYRLLLRKGLQETTISREVFSWSIMVYYILNMFSALHPSLLKDFLTSNLIVPLSDYLISSCLAYLFLLASIHSYIVFSNRTHESLASLIEKCPMLEMVYLNVVHPLIIMITSTSVANHYIESVSSSSHTSGDSNAVTTSLYISLTCVSVCYSLLIIQTRISVPSRSPTSTVSNSSACFHFFLLSVNQMIATVKSAYLLGGDSRPKSWLLLSILSNSIYCTCVMMVCYWRMYWDVSLNDLVTKYCSRLLALSMTGDVFAENSIKVWVLTFIVSEQLLSRLVETLSDRYVLVAINSAKVSWNQLYIGTVYLSEYIEMKDYEKMNDKEKKMFIHYKGEWMVDIQKWRKKENNSSEEIQEASTKSENQKAVDRYLTRLFNKSNRNTNNLKLISLLQTTHPTSFFRLSKFILETLKKKAGSSFFSGFTVFQLQAVWEGKLRYIERNKSSEDSLIEDLTGSLSIFDSFFCAYKLMRVDKSQDNNQSSIGIKQCFDSISASRGLSRSIENFLDAHYDIYDSLFDNTNVSSEFCKSSNEKTMALRIRIGREISLISLFLDVSNLYSYIYPVMIYYFSMISYEMDKLNNYVAMYKKKLGNLILSKAAWKKALPGQQTYNMELDSVAIKISLEKESLGIMKSISLNGLVLLGDSQTKELPIGQSINIFIPCSFVQKHNETLLGDQISSILNKNRTITIIDLRGYARSFRISIKICESVIESISAYALLTLDIASPTPSLILDTRFSVVATNSFLSGISKYRSMHHLTSGRTIGDSQNMGYISEKLMVSMEIISLLNERFCQFQLFQSKNPQAVSTAQLKKDRIYDMASSIVEENKTRGLIHKVEPHSPLFKLYQSLYLHIRGEFMEVFGVKMMKLFIRKQSMQQRENNSGPRLGSNPLQRFGSRAEVDLEREHNDRDDLLSLEEPLSNSQMNGDNNMELQENIRSREYRKEQLDGSWRNQEGSPQEGINGGYNVDVSIFDDLLINLTEINLLLNSRLNGNPAEGQVEGEGDRSMIIDFHSYLESKDKSTLLELLIHHDAINQENSVQNLQKSEISFLGKKELGTIVPETPMELDANNIANLNQVQFHLMPPETPNLKSISPRAGITIVKVEKEKKIEFLEEKEKIEIKRPSSPMTGVFKKGSKISATNREDNNKKNKLYSIRNSGKKPVASQTQINIEREAAKVETKTLINIASYGSIPSILDLFKVIICNSRGENS